MHRSAFPTCLLRNIANTIKVRKSKKHDLKGVGDVFLIIIALVKYWIHSSRLTFTTIMKHVQIYSSRNISVEIVQET